MRTGLNLLVFAIGCLLAGGGAIQAAEYFCPVTAKWDGAKEYDAKQMSKYQYSVRILDEKDNAALWRCSYSSIENSNTCDEYAVDHLAIDPSTGIRKYYYFRGHFDVQLFPSGYFIENNGRGSIASGMCKIIEPW